MQCISSSVAEVSRQWMAIDVLDYYNRRVDDDAEVHRTERKEICGCPGEIEQDEGAEHRQWNIDRSDDGRAQIAKEEHEHQKDQQHSQ